MANSYVEYTATGTGTNQLGQATFSYTLIDVLNGNDIKAFGEASNGTKTELTISSRDTSAKTITLSSAPSSYAKLRVYRQTTSDALVDFVDGARLTESDLDTAYKQGLFVAQEVSEDAARIGTTSTNNLTLQGTTSVTNLTASGTVTANGTTNVNNLTASGTVVIPSGTGATHFYRTGTWTPTVVGYSGTMTPQYANFVKVGKMVHINARLNFSSTTDSDQILIQSMPYSGTTDNTYPIHAMVQTTQTPLKVFLLNSTIHCAKPDNNNLTYTDVSGGYLIINGTYTTG